jgi:hypothetical protein
MSLPILAVRNCAVVKSWLFLVTRKRVPRQPDEGHHVCIYRLDAAGSEMVHEKNSKQGGPMYKTLEMAILFPVARIFHLQPENRGPIAAASGRPPRTSIGFCLS